MKKVIMLCVLLVLVAIPNSALAGKVKLASKKFPVNDQFNDSTAQRKYKLYVTYRNLGKDHNNKHWCTITKKSKYTMREGYEIGYNCNKDIITAVVKRIKVKAYFRKTKNQDWEKVGQKEFQIKKGDRKAGKKWLVEVKHKKGRQRDRHALGYSLKEDKPKYNKIK